MAEAIETKADRHSNLGNMLQNVQANSERVLRDQRYAEGLLHDLCQKYLQMENLTQTRS